MVRKLLPDVHLMDLFLGEQAVNPILVLAPEECHCQHQTFYG